jgi:hypothetical protein
MALKRPGYVVARVVKARTGTSWRYQGVISVSGGEACTPIDEHNRSELETVQKVTLISCWVNEVLMGVYLAIASRISLWRLSYPE